MTIEFFKQLLKKWNSSGILNITLRFGILNNSTFQNIKDRDTILELGQPAH